MRYIADLQYIAAGPGESPIVIKLYTQNWSKQDNNQRLPQWSGNKYYIAFAALAAYCTVTVVVSKWLTPDLNDQLQNYKFDEDKEGNENVDYHQQSYCLQIVRKPRVSYTWHFALHGQILMITSKLWQKKFRNPWWTKTIAHYSHKMKVLS